MKFTASVLFLTSLFPALLSGQDFVSDVAAIRISHSWVPDRKIEGLSTEVGLSEWSVMSPIFYHKSETWSLGAGLRYESTSLDFSDSATLDEDRLQSIDLPLFLGMEQSEKIQWILMLNPSLSGDFEQVDGDTLNYLLLGGARYRKSETFEWFFGAVYSTGFDDDLFLPAIGFKWEPSEKSDLFFAGPILRYRYSFTDSLDLVLAGNLSGNRWNTEAGYGERDLRLRSYRLSLGLQWNLFEKHAVFAAVGTEFAREVEIKNSAGTTLMERDLKTAPSFELGYRFRF